MVFKLKWESKLNAKTNLNPNSYRAETRYRARPTHPNRPAKTLSRPSNVHALARKQPKIARAFARLSRRPHLPADVATYTRSATSPRVRSCSARAQTLALAPLDGHHEPPRPGRPIRTAPRHPGPREPKLRDIRSSLSRREP